MIFKNWAPFRALRMRSRHSEAGEGTPTLQPPPPKREKKDTAREANKRGEEPCDFNTSPMASSFAFSRFSHFTCLPLFFSYFLSFCSGESHQAFDLQWYPATATWYGRPDGDGSDGKLAIPGSNFLLRSSQPLDQDRVIEDALDRVWAAHVEFALAVKDVLLFREGPSFFNSIPGIWFAFYELMLLGASGTRKVLSQRKARQRSIRPLELHDPSDTLNKLIELAVVVQKHCLSKIFFFLSIFPSKPGIRMSE